MKATLNYLFFDILQGKNITENIKLYSDKIKEIENV